MYVPDTLGNELFLSIVFSRLSLDSVSSTTSRGRRMTMSSEWETSFSTGATAGCGVSTNPGGGTQGTGAAMAAVLVAAVLVAALQVSRINVILCREYILRCS